MAAEQNLQDALFGADAGNEGLPTKVDLNSEKQYKEFGGKVGDLLYQGQAPYRIENFFRELCKNMPEHCDSKQIQKIIDHLKVIQATKARAEKDASKPGNKKKAKLAGFDKKGAE